MTGERIFRPIDYRGHDPLAEEAASLVLSELLRHDYAQDPTRLYAAQTRHYANFCVEQDGLFLAAGSLDQRRMPETGAARLEYIAVAEAARGHGVGRFLVKNLEDVAAEKGAGFMRVESVEEAVTFYKRCGYEPISHPDSMVLGKELET